MKQFLKYTLATIAGGLILFLIVFIILASVAGSVSNTDKEFKLKDNSVLKISLDGKLSEQSPENPLNFSVPGLPVNTDIEKQGLDDILHAIKKAESNDKIKGIYVESKSMDAGFAEMEEIRNALENFRKTGKFVVSYADTYDQKEYFVSSVATKVFINPQGMLNLSGLASKPIFFTETLKKLGVKAEVFKVGTFKSAVEPYTNTKMSDANRLQTTEYLNGIWNHLLEKISASRSISIEGLNKIANKSTLFEPATEFVSEKLVDSLLYESEVTKYMAGLEKLDDPDDLHIVSVKKMLQVPEKAPEYKQDKIALLYAEGEIYDEGNEGIVKKDILDEIKKISKDDKIKAVVLRVNSPGGSAYASEQIWKALADLKKKKPIVVSMGDLAASGGYYISCNANKIVASPNTLTGSIGVFGTYFIIDELTNKLGLHFDIVKTNDLSDLGNITRPMTKIEKAKIQRYVENTYNLFITRCSEGRKMSPASVRAIAEGHVWTGQKAVSIGLADEIGGIENAIAEAAKLGKVSKYRIEYFPKKKSYFAELMEQFSDETKMRIATSFLGDEYAPFIKLKESKIQTGILARMDDVTIN